MYTDILVPTDGSAEMGTVADHAFDLAALCDATVHVLYVVDESAYGTVPSDTRKRVREALEGDGRDATKALAERALERGLDVETKVLTGLPAATIISYAVDNDVDVVVMGTHGRTGYEYYLLGSVAEKVVQYSPVPVMTVRVGELDVSESLFELDPS